MEKAPKIGARVRYFEVLFPGETYQETRTVVGTVIKVYPKRICLTDDDDPRWDDSDFIPSYGGPAPQREWQVSLKVDIRPVWWPYGNQDTFCPEVRHLELI